MIFVDYLIYDRVWELLDARDLKSLNRHDAGSRLTSDATL
jgi:hypothetical protein